MKAPVFIFGLILALGAYFFVPSLTAIGSVDDEIILENASVDGELILEDVLDNASSFMWGHKKVEAIKRIENDEAICYIYIGYGISCFRKGKCPDDVDTLPNPGPGSDPCGGRGC